MTFFRFFAENMNKMENLGQTGQKYKINTVKLDLRWEDSTDKPMKSKRSGRRAKTYSHLWRSDQDDLDFCSGAAVSEDGSLLGRAWISSRQPNGILLTGCGKFVSASRFRCASTWAPEGCWRNLRSLPFTFSRQSVIFIKKCGLSCTGRTLNQESRSHLFLVE